MTFKAKYDGRCAECHETIYRGDLLEHVDGQVIHTDCTPDETKPEVARPTCPKCWLVIAANGECGCDE